MTTEDRSAKREDRSDAEKVPERPLAQWRVELNVDCPKCGEYVDLLNAPDFWDGRTLALAEDRSALEVNCPECGHEFEVDCVY